VATVVSALVPADWTGMTTVFRPGRRRIFSGTRTVMLTALVMLPPSRKPAPRHQASLVSSTRFIEPEAAVWSNNTVRVMARNISAATFDLAAATLSVGVAKRRVP
jgi:hypothetical protein